VQYSTSDPVGYASTLAPIVPPSLTSAGANGAELGKTVTLNKGTWNTTGVALSYQWTRNGVPIPGVTGLSYVPTAEKLGDEIAELVTAKQVGYATVIVSTGALVTTIGDPPVFTVKPTVTGTAAGQSTLTASTGTWNVDGLTFSYQWNAVEPDGTTIDPIVDSNSTLVVPCTAAGDRIFVQVTAHRAGYTDSHVESTPGPVVKIGTCV
jgi:hypothetical protein